MNAVLEHAADVRIKPKWILGGEGRAECWERPAEAAFRSKCPITNHGMCILDRDAVPEFPNYILRVIERPGDGSTVFKWYHK